MEIRKRINEIEYLLQRLDTPLIQENNKQTIQSYDLLTGISFIIPVYNGSKYFDRLINSLSNVISEQIPFEFIFIFNGEMNVVESEQVLLEQMLNNQNIMKYCHFLNSEQGASFARNKGIEIAKYEYTVFLDCDDALSNQFIDNVYPHLKKNAIVLFDLHEYRKGVSDAGNNVIQKEASKFHNKSTQNYIKIAKSLSMNGAKIIPTSFIKNIKFKEYLKSGEDVVLMMNITATYMPVIQILPKNLAVYHRYLEDNSVSRQKLNYSFNVTERIEVIKALSQLLSIIDQLEIRQLIMNRMDAQAGFINRYLQENPSDYLKVIEEISAIQSEYLPFSKINDKLAKTLYVGYCFAPYADTSGIVLSKRIHQFHEPCDVISNKMESIRNKDYRLSKISELYVRKHYELNCKPSFSHYGLMMDFVNKGLRKIDVKQYNKVYSRVLWPASHLLAYKIKCKNNHVKWCAEFSDPVLYDIHNKKRYSKVSHIYFKQLKKKIPDKWKKYLDNNLYNLIELIPFAFADELIFTNINQQNSMIERFDQEIRNDIKQRSKILPHPTLSFEFYKLDDSLIEFDESYFNIGYFGNFYDTRSADDVLKVISDKEKLIQLNPKNKPIKLNVFTNNANQIQQNLHGQIEQDQINVYNFVPFFEFLNLTTRMDALLILDAHTKGIKEENPYLPSKMSDYIGSGKPIIAFVEENSPLDQLSLSQVSKMLLNDKNV